MPTIRPDTGAPRGFGPLAQHGQARTVSDSEMSDDERELAIKEAGAELVRLQAIYEGSGCFWDCAARDEARRYMEALIRGRSAAQVRAMERRLGLA